MYLYLTDESNKPPELDRFFIYGGLVIDSEGLPELDRLISDIRARRNYAPGDTFKFSNVDSKDVEEHRVAKAEVLGALVELRASFIVTLTLRQLLVDQENGEIKSDMYVEWAINTATAGFHKFLRSKGSHGGHGAMFIDRDKDQSRFSKLADRYQRGLAPTGYELAVNDRIHLFGMTNNNASHLSSAVDIALGAFRYCVDFACGVGREEVAQELMHSVSQLIWRSPDGRQFREYGYIPRPVLGNIGSAEHRKTYERVARILTELAALRS